MPDLELCIQVGPHIREARNFISLRIILVARETCLRDLNQEYAGLIALSV